MGGWTSAWRAVEAVIKTPAFVLTGGLESWGYGYLLGCSIDFNFKN